MKPNLNQIMELKIDEHCDKSKEKQRDKSTSYSSLERKEKSAAEKEKDDKDRRERRKYASDVIDTIMFRQENKFVQLILLINQLNLVIGSQPIEAFAMYPGILYSMLALLTGLNVLDVSAEKNLSILGEEMIETKISFSLARTQP